MSPFSTSFAHASFLETFLRCMAFSLKRGVPVLEFLRMFQRTHQIPAACRESLAKVADSVRAGTPLSEALDRGDGVFPAWLIAGMRAGERGVHLDRVAERMACTQSQQCHFLRLLERDWAYPLFLSATIVALVAGLGLLMLPDLMQKASLAARGHPAEASLFPVLDAVVRVIAGARAIVRSGGRTIEVVVSRMRARGRMGHTGGR
jgi:type II secretory pathway component PulF